VIPKPIQTEEQKRLRVTAYEMYLKGHLDQGKKISFRAIAMALGVTDGAVRYWWTHDRWDQRIDSALTQRTIATTRGSQAISNLLRSSLYQNMVVLNRIIADDARTDGIRIKAISEFADICLKLKVIQPEDLLGTPTTAPTPAFKDDLNGYVDGRRRDAGPEMAGPEERPGENDNRDDNDSTTPANIEHGSGSSPTGKDDAYILEEPTVDGG
jgi:hypothetical protein